MVDVEDKGTEVVGTNKGKELLEPKPSTVQAGDAEIAPNSNYQAYPEALANYQEVVANKSLFMESLEKLHLAMRTKFMIPTIGGKELDLHRLFTEVTSRGGIEKVIGDRRWREVTNVFNFPSTATNASFVLRKYYISLLRHYEQIYFFGAKGWSIPSAVSQSTTPTNIIQPEKKIESSAFSFSEAQSAPRKRRKGNGEVAQTGPAFPINRTVIGVIDGKFDDGYFVTVTIGATKLKGVLFHASQQNAVQGQPAFPGIIDNSDSRVICRRRRRKKLSSRDPTHPKPNRSGYNFFFAEQHARLKLLHPGKDRAISKMIGDLWNKLTETDRAVYQEIGLKDKQRYQSEMAVYKERQRTGLVLTNVMPIQQFPAEPSIDMQNMNLKETDDTDLLSENGTDTEGEKLEEESELRNSPEAGAAAAETASIAVDPSAFELRSRSLTETGSDTEMGNVRNNLPGSDDNPESEETAETSSDKQ